ncbi:exonuclease family protein [Babesia ovata]|uniref:Exonuclease family protein n=1 Tax=Babesia ovata TaxID=189622 RepID=A0A2H6K815_9APIC|nr:exonuclease family protein [Babesia ovata]GBE59135.1 exonuclease family protein [Babesia ovata]
MRNGILKYDRWEDLVWVYNGIHSNMRTPLTGSIVGISAEDNSVKYNHWGMQNGGHYGAGKGYQYNEYCGCYMCTVNAIQPYETGLIVSNAKGVELVNRDGGRRMRLTSERAESQISNQGAAHIVCSLLNCTPNNTNIWLATNAEDLFSVDALTGQISGTMKLSNAPMSVPDSVDQITAVANLNGDNSASSCIMSYHQQYDVPHGHDAEQPAEFYPQNEAYNASASSLESIARKYGSFEAIPEFIPSSGRVDRPKKLFTKHKMPQEKTSGAIALGYAIQSQNYAAAEKAYPDTICVGMLSGLLHVVDHRMQKVAHTVEAHSNAVGSISAYGNYVVTTGCYLYGNTPIYEPLLQVHDLRMGNTGSIWVGSPIKATAVVPSSNKVVALRDDGGFFECDLTTMEFVKYPRLNDGHSWIYHDIDVSVDISKGVYRVFMADEVYAVNSIELPNEVGAAYEMDPANLKPIFQKIKDQNKYSNTTHFASMIGTFHGDLVQVFVQVFFFLERLTSIRYHSCEVEHCLTCQVGFAMHMLHVAHENMKQGIVEEECKFTPAKRSELRATQLQELMPVDRSETSASSIQRLLLWIIEKMNSELDTYYGRDERGYASNEVQLIKNVFGFSKTVDSKCANGHRTTKTLENEFCLDYTLFVSGQADDEEIVSYCTECKKLVRTKYHTEVSKTPNFMIVHCNQDQQGEQVTRIDEHVTFKDDAYELISVLFSVPPEDSSYRLLAYIRVPQTMKDKQEWILINDGYVCELAEEDLEQMLDFSAPWKRPITLIYRKKALGAIKDIDPAANAEMTVVNINGRIVPLPIPSTKVPIPASIFISESNIAHNPRAHDKYRTFVPLSVNELLSLHLREFIVALDIEGVETGNESLGLTSHRSLPDDNAVSNASLQQKKSFLYSAKEDGDQNLASIARVSAVRGSGEASGVPFLDHYIHRRKPPKDYLTRFSGIHHGDLDLKSSVHWLTTRKAIYMKIRYLIDAGCKILGHGLEQDFKMLNIVVPHGQVIDTVELFRLPRRRYISLQYLAAYILHQQIQRGEHDSVEDAKAALNLYRKYLLYDRNGELPAMLAELYDVGYKTNWVVTDLEPPQRGPVRHVRRM